MHVRTYYKHVCAHTGTDTQTLVVYSQQVALLIKITVAMINSMIQLHYITLGVTVIM